MSLKRHATFLAPLLLLLCCAVSAQAAKEYSLAKGSGAQLHIGNGLALPIQQAATVLVTGQVFPPLLIPRNSADVGFVRGTTTMTTRQKITVPTSALKKPAAQKTVGVFFSNTTLYAVGTNLSYAWPAAQATLATANAVQNGATATTFSGAGGLGSIRYAPRVVGKKFGGPGLFRLGAGPAAGLLDGAGTPAQANAPVTIYALGGGAPGAPPCTHPAFGGPNPACVAVLIGAIPTGNNVGVGHPAGTVVMTPGAVAAPGIGVVKAGANPLGTISAFAFTPNGNPGPFTNMATSTGYPFTTAEVSVKVAAVAETFVISGNDLRTAGGAGTLQLVSGAVSTRAKTGPNANRGWIRLVLTPPVPAMSPSALAAGAGLMLLAFGYALRKRHLSS